MGDTVNDLAGANILVLGDVGLTSMSLRRYCPYLYNAVDASFLGPVFVGGSPTCPAEIGPRQLLVPN